MRAGRLTADARHEWVGGAGLLVAACASVYLETCDWCAEAACSCRHRCSLALVRVSHHLISPPLLGERKSIAEYQASKIC